MDWLSYSRSAWHECGLPFLCFSHKLLKWRAKLDFFQDTTIENDWFTDRSFWHWRCALHHRKASEWSECNKKLCLEEKFLHKANLQLPAAWGPLFRHLIQSFNFLTTSVLNWSSSIKRNFFLRLYFVRFFTQRTNSFIGNKRFRNITFLILLVIWNLDWFKFRGQLPKLKFYFFNILDLFLRKDNESLVLVLCLYYLETS